jgi:hypothetical protein
MGAYTDRFKGGSHLTPANYKSSGGKRGRKSRKGGKSKKNRSRRRR